ncbi:MAG: hypothetical protein AAGF12_01425 [Myxococcota bacterium]
MTLSSPNHAPDFDDLTNPPEGLGHIGEHPYRSECPCALRSRLLQQRQVLAQELAMLDKALEAADRELGGSPPARRTPRLRRGLRLALLLGIGAAGGAVAAWVSGPDAPTEVGVAPPASRAPRVEVMPQRTSARVGALASSPPRPAEASSRASSEAFPWAAPAEGNEAGVKRIGATAWEVSRDAASAAVRTPGGLRILPVTRGGFTVGVRVYGIRRDSTLAKLGFQNGDLLTQLNGFSMNSPDRALAAYAALREAKTWVVELERRGEARTHVYRLTE